MGARRPGRLALVMALALCASCSVVSGVDEFATADRDEGEGGEGAGGAAGGPPTMECGNGLREAPEECDDGGTIAGDGCDASCVVECEEGFKEPAQFHCYRWFGAPLDWHAARAACLALGPDQDLVAISTYAERDYIDDVVLPPTGVWTGGTDARTPGSYQWTNGEPWNFDEWEAGEPNFSGDCVGLTGFEGLSNDRLHDTSCTTLNEYICEYTPAGG